MIKQKGQSLVELLVVIGLSALIIPSFLTGLISSRSGKAQQLQKDQATIYLKQNEEILRHIKDTDWNHLTSFGIGNSLLHINQDISGKDWVLDTGSTIVDGFTQKIELFEVRRNSSDGKISEESQYQIDPSIIKAVTTISWNNPISTTLSTTTYLTRYNSNVTKPIDSTTKVELEKSGIGDWCAPNLINGSGSTFPIPANSNGQNLNSFAGISSGQSNHAYITTGNNASSSPLYGLVITNSINPVVTSDKSYNGVVGAYGVFSDSSHIFITTNKNSPVVDIINSPDFTRYGSYDTGEKGGNSVYVKDHIGYVTSNNSLYAFDIATTKPLWNKKFNNTGYKIIVSGNYAYIATSATSKSQQLQIIDVGTTDDLSYSPPQTGIVSISTTKPGVDVAVLGNYAYLITEYSSETTPDIFIIDISNPKSPKVVGTANTYDSATNSFMKPLGIATTPDNVIIVVGDGGLQYQAFRVNNPSNPSRCGQLQNPNNANKIVAISTIKELDGDVYSYILTEKIKDQIFQIITGGLGGGIYKSTRTYISQAIGFTNPVVFNRFNANTNTPSGTSITFQIGIGNTEVGIGCNHDHYDFIGPNKTSDVGDTFPANGSIPWGNHLIYYKNPGQCFKYKAFLSTSDTNITPILYDFNINYSP